MEILKYITLDKTILDTVEGCHIEITNEYELNLLNRSYPLRFMKEKLELCLKSIQNVRQKGH